jgi:hypothetical protein
MSTSPGTSIRYKVLSAYETHKDKVIAVLN